MRYTQDEKHQIVKACQSGQKTSDLSKQYNVSKSTLYNWIHQYGENKADSGKIVSAKRLHLLEKRIHRFTMENEIWRKYKCTIDSPLPQKLEAIKNLHEEYGVHACCRVLGVLRSAFYHYLFRSPEQTMIEKEDDIYTSRL